MFSQALWGWRRVIILFWHVEKMETRATRLKKPPKEGLAPELGFLAPCPVPFTRHAVSSGMGSGL